MYELRPSDIALPPTVSIDLSHFVVIVPEARASTTENPDDSERAA
ncbi:hypothetical protein [Microbacterium sp. A84]